MLTILVRKLDGDVLNVQAERKDKGEVVFDKVCESVDLVEKDYFGLQYEDKMGVTNWLDLNKRLGRTMKSDHWEFQFAVKFYPPDPSQLQEDVTRYQLCLQIRNDILTGKLLCSFVTYAMLGSYLVQSELGDYSPEEYPDASYLKNFRFAPDQTPQLEAKVMELHKTHKGQTPAEAELHYLENVKKLAMYGVDFHPAKDSEGVDITLGVCSTGLLVYHERLRINRFAWPKILKISYKRNYFYVKIRPGDYEPYENTIAFKLDSHRAAKRLWNVCVEHHTFFRLMTPEDVARPGLIPGLSNKFPSLRKTHYQTKRNTIEREPPSSFRKSQRYPTSKSLDPLVEQPSNREKDTANKRHTMPPENTQTSPVKREKRIPGAVPVLPVGEFRKKEREQKENGVANESDDEKENRNKEDNRYKEEKKSKKSTGLGLFKKNEGKRDKMEEIGVKREYEYDYEGDEPTSRKRSPKGFSYEKRNVEDYAEEEEYEEGMERRSPTKGRTYAFNYAPELDNKSPEPEEKHSSLSGFFKKKKKDDSSSPKRDSPLSTFLVGKSKDKDSSAKDKSKESDSPAKDKSKERDSPAKDKLKEKDPSLKEKLKDKETSFSFKMKDKEASSKDKSKNKESTSKDKSTDKDSPAKDKLKEKDASLKDKSKDKESKEKSKDKDSLTDKFKGSPKDASLKDKSKDKESKEKSKDKESLTDKFKGSLSLSAKEKSKDKDKESGKSKLKEFLEAEKAGRKSPDVSEKKKDSLSPKGLFRWGKRKDEDDDGGKPKVMKTTTKQSVVKDGGNVTHNIEEKIEVLTSGDVTLNTAESLMEDQGRISEQSPKGFSYEKRNVEDHAEEEECKEGTEERSPTKGLNYGFNYAPELDNKSPEPEEKHSSLSGFFKKKKKDDSSSPKRDSPLSTFLVGKSKDKDSSAKDKSKESDSPAKDKSKERGSPAKDKLKEKDASLKEKLKDKETSFSFKMKDKEASSKDKSKNKESTSKDKSTDEDSPAKDKLKDKDSLTDRFKGSLSLSAKDKSKDKDKESGKSKSKEFLEAEEAGHKSPDVSEKKKDSLSPKGLFRWGKRKDEDDDGGKPKVVKTTTKQSVVKDGGNVTHNIEEKIEDLTSGDVTLNTAESLMEDQGSSPYVMATAVTTRTAMTTEDLGKNAKTSQVEEKTVARTTTTSGTRQEQRVVTQEVRATTVVSEPQDTRRSSMSSTSSDDSGTPIDLDVSTSYCLPPYQEPIVETEAVFITSGKTEMPQATTTAPLVTTSTGLIGPPTIQADTIVSGEIISSQTITSKTRTVETVTYKTEKDGVVETRVEQKITIQSDGDPIDHDKALAEAIQEATAMNPDMQVEKIEIQQESLPK
ncbi:protein 4.1 homolog isoform X2 [Cimex lectularius]|uniref:Moesin/ezrin/radixin homolog 1 n=1 Tax=Cimex lectularius TaxID=79782 RepID=A0A8I6SSK4_CIMLE|nr:protein 4.1 homolog isoform X2 [Cimex lectularius]